MKIYVDAGHTKTGLGSGAVGILNESMIVREVAKELIKFLEKEGHEVKLGQIESEINKGDNFKKEVAEANEWKADYFISLHCNAHNGSAKGVEVLKYSKSDNRVEGVLNSISSLGFKNRGVKFRTDLYVLKNTKMNAMLIECFFVDNKNDCDTYMKIGSKRLAKAIAEGFLGKTIIDDVKPPTIDSKQLYAVCVGAYNKENADKILKEVKSKGYKDAYLIAR